MIQSLAALAMVCLHLFDRYDYSGLYQPLLYIGDYPLCFYFAQLSDWCVMGFAFCSGYSHYRMSLTLTKKEYKSRSLTRLLSLYCNYWIALILAVIVSIFISQADIMPGQFWEFLGNFSSIICTYNISWWYLLIYAIIVFLSPFLLENAKKNNSVMVSILFSFVYCFGYYFRFLLGNYWVFEKIGKLCMTVFEYMLGVIFAKGRLFTKIYGVVSRISKHVSLMVCYVAVGIVFIMMLLGHTLISGNIIFAPVNGIIIITAFWLWDKPDPVKHFLIFIGKHSTNIWLTHLFLYASLFTNLVFIAKYPPVIFCFMIVLTIVVSMGVELFMVPIREKIRTVI